MNPVVLPLPGVISPLDVQVSNGHIGPLRKVDGAPFARHQRLPVRLRVGQRFALVTRPKEREVSCCGAKRAYLKAVERCPTVRARLRWLGLDDKQRSSVLFSCPPIFFSRFEVLVSRSGRPKK